MARRASAAPVIELEACGRASCESGPSVPAARSGGPSTSSPPSACPPWCSACSGSGTPRSRPSGPRSIRGTAYGPRRQAASRSARKLCSCPGCASRSRSRSPRRVPLRSAPPALTTCSSRSATCTPGSGSRRWTKRRLGEGRLAQLAGPTDLASDKFELELGLLRTAEQEWAQMPKASPPALALIDYAEGVNDDLAQVRASGQWPAVFSLPGVYPGPWTPVDSLVIQGELSQELDFTTTPLDYALLERSLGPALTMAWFPIIAKNAQTPYDPGPYPKPALVPLAPGAASTLTPGQLTAHRHHPPPASSPAARARSRRTVPGHAPRPVRAYLGRSAGGGHAARPAQPAARRAAARIPGQQRVGGRRARGHGRRRPAGRGPAPAADAAVGLVRGRLVRAGPRRGRGQRAGPARDPHRAQRPYRLVADRHAEPGHLLLPRGDRQSRPGQYYWDGAWRNMQVVHYQIPVRGAATVNLTVDITVHGPIMTQAGQTTSVDWMGNVPSPDLAAINGIYQASTFASSRRPWPAGTPRRRTSSTRTRPGTSARSRRATIRRSGRAASPGCR